MKRIVLPLFLLFSLPVFASFEVTGSSIQRSPRAAHARLYREEAGFFVDNNGEKEFVSATSAFKNNPQLWKAFLKENYIRLDRHEDGHYSLQPKVRGNGGGPITGAAAGVTAGVVGGVLIAGAFIGCLAHGNLPGAYIAATTGASATVWATIKATAIGAALPTP